MMISLETHDSYKIAKYWTFFCIVSLFLFIFTIQKSSYFEMDVLGMWVLSCLAILYLSRKNPGQFSVIQRRIIILFGILICILSFTSISWGITNPPYSIGEFSLFLSGIGVIIFGLYNFRSLVLPVSIPCMAVIGFWAYEQFIRNQEWITAPVIPYIVIITVSILHLLGVNAIPHGNIISFLSQNGGMIYLSIVSDCSGVWSLGTFTIAVAIVLSSFPQSISKKSILVIGVGYLGTFCANIIRIVAIALSGYYFGPTGVIEQVHVHIGWIVFSAWMIIFWYYYFTRYAGISFFKKRKSPDKMTLANDEFLK